MQTTRKPAERQDGKLQILRPLYERGVDSQFLRRLYRVIDWLLDLPPDRELSFWEELRKIEEIKISHTSRLWNDWPERKGWNRDWKKDDRKEFLPGRFRSYNRC